jgi:hypothetical protein
MLKISEPGIYRDVSEADYRADPCPKPSLTQSTCKTLIASAPAKAFAENARLNPNCAGEDDEKAFDLGNVAHRLVLGRGKDFEVMDYSDWRTKIAKEARAEVIKAGRVPILEDQFGRALLMNDHLRAQLDRHEDRNAFTNGAAEVMIAWEEGGFWYRSLIDWLHDDLRTVDDYKSSGMSMAPHMLGIRAESAGWHVQAAFIERGLDILDPAGAGRRKFRFIGQETDEPYLMSVMHMDEYWLTMGRKKVAYADTTWRICLTRNQWPGYPPRGQTPDFPGFKEKQWLDREIAEASENDPTLIYAG